MRPARGFDPARERDALALFEELEALDEPTRSAALAARCAGDDALRARVERLFAADRDASRLIASDPPRSATPPPTRIGPYRLAELLGVGGMGAVYRGERDDGLFEQSVAIKLVRPGLLSTSAQAQFAVERRILARLRHPGIAQLFDGGVDASGHSYIVMELMRGETLAEWMLGAHPLRARLELFRAICGAVQFAHQSLVVHADLKPRNVFVTPEGAPKLLDFGIARLVGDAEHGEADAASAHALTPAYAAPERAAGAAASVAGDVYGLGAVLAELLTGDAAARALPATMRPKLLRDDLAAILAKACAPEPAARYATVAELAADLERALGDRPVRAREPTLGVRAQKLARRQRWPLAAATALVGATLATGVLYARAERARREADARFEDTRALARYQIFDLYDGLQRLPGALPLRQQLVDRAQGYLDRLAASPRAPRSVRLEAAVGFGRLATLQGVPSTPNLGRTADARANLARGRVLLEALLREAPGAADARVELAQLAVHEARIALWSDQSLDAARAAVADARAQLNAADALPRSARWLEVDAQARQAELEALDFEAAPAAVAERARALLAALDAWPAALRSEDGYANARARALLKEGDGLYYLGDPDAALARYVAADALLRDAEARLPGRPALMMNRVVSAWAVATTLHALGRLQEALPVFDDAVAQADRLREFERVDQQIQRSRAIARQARAEAWIAVGRVPEALAELRDVAAGYRATADAAPGEPSRRRDLASAETMLGRAHFAAHDAAAACGAFAEASVLYRALIAEGALMPGDANETIPDLNAHAPACAAAGAPFDVVSR